MTGERDEAADAEAIAEAESRAQRELIAPREDVGGPPPAPVPPLERIAAALEGIRAALEQAVRGWGRL